MPVVASLVVIMWMAFALICVENERYALASGMCRDAVGMADAACLAPTRTLTQWAWHLWYALKN
jgi:hypothetical protein